MERLNRLTPLLMQRGLTHMIFAPGASFRYLTGLGAHQSERLTMLGLGQNGNVALLLPHLEASSAAGVNYGSIFTYGDAEGPQAAVQAFSHFLGINENSRVGVEKGQMRLFEADFLRELGCALTGADDIVMSLRLRKDQGEIRLLKEAVQIVDDALASTIPLLRLGMSELEVAAELEYQMRRLGSAGVPFGTIVGSGPRGALPHGGPTDRKIQQGELVVLDYGARRSGYAADTTRTIAFGEPEVDARRVYEVVKKAQAAAAAAVGPGMAVADIDRIARDMIAEAGFGEYFTHRTGHGLGLDVHEYPSIVQGSDVILLPGMVFTIEPGVYLPERFGVRIEDDILVTESGAEILTQFTRELIVV